MTINIGSKVRIRDSVGGYGGMEGYVQYKSPLGWWGVRVSPRGATHVVGFNTDELEETVFKDGDRVRIIADIAGKGEVGTLRPNRKESPYPFLVEGVGVAGFVAVHESEIEKVEVKVGDLVRVIDAAGYTEGGYVPVGTLARITDVPTYGPYRPYARREGSTQWPVDFYIDKWEVVEEPEIGDRVRIMENLPSSKTTTITIAVTVSGDDVDVKVVS